VTAEWEHALKGYAVRLSGSALTELRKNPNILAVYPDESMHMVGAQTPVGSWGQDRVDQRTSVLDNSYTYNNSASNVHAYIIDTGINPTHNEYASRIDAVHSMNFTTATTTAWQDQNGHGSHVAGTIGGATYGLAKGVTLHAIRVLDAAGSGQFSWYISGINWIIANKQLPAVANASLGGSVFAPADQATDALVAAGVTFGVASGNSNVDACTQSPSNRGVTAGVISVNAAGNWNSASIPPTPVDTRATFSDFGACTDIYAPGVYITSAWIGSNTAADTISGTSMATPHVVGAAALYLGANPTWTPAQVEAAMKADATTGVIIGNPANTPNLLLYTGNIGGSLPTNQPPHADFTITCIVGRCDLDAAPSTDDGGLSNLTFAWLSTSDGRGPKTGQKISRSLSVYASTFQQTLVVTDAGGLTNSITKTVTIPAAVNQPPTALITAPANNSSFPQGQSITFQGSGSDPENGVLTGASLVWTSNVSGQIGTGVSFSTSTLPVGTHLITLTAKDAAGLPGTASITIQITAVTTNQPPHADFTISCVVGRCDLDAAPSTDDGGFGNLTFAWLSTSDGRGAKTGQKIYRALSVYSHVFQQTLVVTDAGGLTNSITKTVTIP
jgi:hypothetical protein